MRDYLLDGNFTISTHLTPSVRGEADLVNIEVCNV